MKILFMRHGYAGQRIMPQFSDADRARELTPDGEKRVQAMAQYLTDQGYEPDAIFSSPVARTQQTAGILADHFFGNAKRFTVDPNLDEDAPLEMALVARTQDDSVKAPLMVCHHNNMKRLHHLEGDFMPDPDPMATAEVRVIKVKRGNVEAGTKRGDGPTAKWKEIQRLLPSEADGGLEDIY